MSFTIGSLFDGSGGFPLAAFMCGGVPVWASEVEPYPIAVTKSRFPYMEHLGDISKINGAKVKPVDVISFGSPCQDLSVAGLRKGLKHEDNGDDETTRSGLFMEAVRIIKEMREATNGAYPRVALWENVPGAFSSNKGEDFRVVLEELVKIVEPTAVMPTVPKAGWPYADCYRGDGWSIAYRVLDAQFWGVPQRRRRIYLVLDLGGERAGEILFKRESLRGYFAEGGTPWQGVASDAERSTGTDDSERNGIIAVATQPVVCYEAAGLTNRGYYSGEKAETLRGESHGALPMVCIKTWDARSNGDGDTVSTLAGDHENRITDYTSVVVEEAPVYCLQGNGIDRADTAGCNGKGWNDESCYTLNTIDRPAVCYVETYQKCTGPLMANSHPGSYTGQDAFNDMLVAGPETQIYRQGGFAEYIEGECGTLRAARGDFGGGSENLLCVRYIVRRLTPTECARLQGFPDEWGHPDVKDALTNEEYAFWLEVRNTHAAINGKTTKEYTKQQMLTWYNKLHTDSAEYKMWGNGIALPTALYVMQGIAEVFA